MSKKHPSPSSSTFFDDIPIPVAFDNRATPNSFSKNVQQKTAIIYCEANFGGPNGRSANALIRQSEDFEIIAIIDSQKADRDAGEVLNARTNGIPILRSLTQALAYADHVPGYLIFGIDRASGKHSPAENRLILKAIDRGMTIINGLQEFSNNDSEFAPA